MIRKNFLLEKLRNSDTACLGTWSVIPSPILAEAVCSAGLDFFIIDGEHGPVGFERAQEIAIACENAGVSPIMRVPEVAQACVLSALEIGVHGIQVPNIEGRGQLDDLVRFSKYPPLGKRGFSPFTRASGYTSDNAAKVVSGANENTLTIVHIEGEAGVSNVDQILECPTVDVYFIGLFDLSCVLGRPGEVDHPEIVALFRGLVAKIIDAGKIAGSISNSEAQLEFLIDSGVRYITHSVDCHVVSSAYRKLVDIKERKAGN